MKKDIFNEALDVFNGNEPMSTIKDEESMNETFLRVITGGYKITAFKDDEIRLIQNALNLGNLYKELSILSGAASDTSNTDPRHIDLLKKIKELENDKSY